MLPTRGFEPWFNPAGSVALEQQHHCWLLWVSLNVGWINVGFRRGCGSGTTHRQHLWDSVLLGLMAGTG